MKTRKPICSIGPCTGMLYFILSGIAFGSLTEIEISTPTLLASHTLPDGGVLKVQRETISFPYLFQDQMKVGKDTLYFLDLGSRVGEKPIRLWEEAFGFQDFSRPGPGMPKGFVLAVAEGRTSSVALAFWESQFFRFLEINPRKPVGRSFEDLIRKTAGKRPQASNDDGKPYYPTKSGRNWLNFENLIPGYFLDAAFLDSPTITKLWHDKEAWHITFAARQMQVHLLLRDGAKEWVWINKP